MDKSVGEWDQRVSSFILGLEEGPGEEEGQGQGQEQGQAVQQQEQGVWGVEQLRRCGAFPSLPLSLSVWSPLWLSVRPHGCLTVVCESAFQPHSYVAKRVS